MNWKPLLAALAVLLVCGCAPRQSIESANPAPSSSLTMDQAKAYVNWWTFGHPDHAAFNIAPTGSMLPVLDSHSIVLVERFTGVVNTHDICIYDHDPSLPAVCHRVVKIDLANKAVIFEGDNNPGSDGWISMSRINWRVAGILYTQRTINP